MILDGLRGCRVDHPIYQAVLALLDHHIEIADQLTLVEDITDSARARRAGAEWQARTLKATLLIMHSKANQAPPIPRAG